MTENIIGKITVPPATVHRGMVFRNQAGDTGIVVGLDEWKAGGVLHHAAMFGLFFVGDNRCLYPYFSAELLQKMRDWHYSYVGDVQFNIQ